MMTLLINLLHDKNIHDNCLVHREMLFIDKHECGFSVMGVKHINTFLLFSIVYGFKTFFCQEG